MTVLEIWEIKRIIVYRQCRHNRNRNYLYFLVFLASQIPPEQYGEIFYYIGIAATAAAFALIGAQNTITVYSSKNIRVESTLYFLSLILGIIASFILMLIFIEQT